MKKRKPSNLSIKLHAPTKPWRNRPTNALIDEGGACLALPTSGWLHFCVTCTRPHSQKVLFITQRRGGENHVVNICQHCQRNGTFQRFSPHISFVVLKDHMREPIRDVNAEADEMIAKYKAYKAHKAKVEAEKRREEEKRIRQRRQMRLEKNQKLRKRCTIF
jgi:hypothetical protein